MHRLFVKILVSRMIIVACVTQMKKQNKNTVFMLDSNHDRVSWT